MSNKVKDRDTRNRTYYFFNSFINKKNLFQIILKGVELIQFATLTGCRPLRILIQPPHSY